MSYSPFVGQKLHFHRFGRYKIQEHICSVYYSEFFNFVGEKTPHIAVTIHVHVKGILPKLHYIISEDGSVKSYLNSNSYEDEKTKKWVELYSNVIWRAGLKRKKNKELPQIY